MTCWEDGFGTGLDILAMAKSAACSPYCPASVPMDERVSAAMVAIAEKMRDGETRRFKLMDAAKYAISEVWRRDLHAHGLQRGGSGPMQGHVRYWSEFTMPVTGFGQFENQLVDQLAAAQIWDALEEEDQLTLLFHAMKHRNAWRCQCTDTIARVRELAVS